MKQKINLVYKFTVEKFGRHFENRRDVILAVMSPTVFSLETFPNDGKQAKISPIYNEGNKNDLNSIAQCLHYGRYRKLLKKCFEPIIYDYLIANNVLYKFQSGYKPLQSLYHHSHFTPRRSKQLTSI